MNKKINNLQHVWPDYVLIILFFYPFEINLNIYLFMAVLVLHKKKPPKVLYVTNLLFLLEFKILTM